VGGLLFCGQAAAASEVQARPIVGRKVHESVAYLLLCYVDVYPHLNNKLLLIMCQYLDMLKQERLAEVAAIQERVSALLAERAFTNDDFGALFLRVARHALGACQAYEHIPLFTKQF